MSEATFIAVGMIVGASLAAVAFMLWRRAHRSLAEALLKNAQQQSEQQLSTALRDLKTAFAALSRDALSANTDDFLKLAKTSLERHTVQADQTLETKKKLIDARLGDITGKLADLSKVIQSIDKQRVESHGSLKGQLEKITQATNRLQDTTGELREALANPQQRGQWGERMAEDVLRLAGFIEGVNYVKQKRLPGGTIPDLTFLLPGNQCVHMDVKFPLANYMKLMEADDDAARQSFTAMFIKDVRSRIKEVTTRGYIDPALGTLDYVLVFIPIEQMFGFIHEHDRTLLDYALEHKVILCSPLTLYAILAVMRQSIDTFRLEKASNEILTLLAEFRKQWNRYTESMDKVGKRLDDTMRAYTDAVGVRTRQLDRQLDKIEDLRTLRRESETGPPHGLAPSGSIAAPTVHETSGTG